MAKLSTHWWRFYIHLFDLGLGFPFSPFTYLKSEFYCFPTSSLSLGLPMLSCVIMWSLVSFIATTFSNGFISSFSDGPSNPSIEVPPTGIRKSKDFISYLGVFLGGSNFEWHGQRLLSQSINILSYLHLSIILVEWPLPALLWVHMSPWCPVKCKAITRIYVWFRYDSKCFSSDYKHDCLLFTNQYSLFSLVLADCTVHLIRTNSQSVRVKSHRKWKKKTICPRFSQEEKLFLASCQIQMTLRVCVC